VYTPNYISLVDMPFDSIEISAFVSGVYTCVLTLHNLIQVYFILFYFILFYFICSKEYS